LLVWNKGICEGVIWTSKGIAGAHGYQVIVTRMMSRQVHMIYITLTGRFRAIILEAFERGYVYVCDNLDVFVGPSNSPAESKISPKGVVCSAGFLGPVTEECSNS